MPENFTDAFLVVKRRRKRFSDLLPHLQFLFQNKKEIETVPYSLIPATPFTTQARASQICRGSKGDVKQGWDAPISWRACQLDQVAGG